MSEREIVERAVYTNAYRDKQLFWVWLAGFWEGEGSAFVSEGNRATFGIGQQGKRGKKVCLYMQKETGFGHIYPNKTPTGKTLYYWKVTSLSQVMEILERIKPYLRFREKQVEQVLLEAQKADDRARRHDWNPRELNIIKENTSLTDKELVKLLPRHSKASIQDRRLKLGLKKGERRCYSSEETEKLLLMLHKGHPIKEIARLFGRSAGSVYNKLQRLRAKEG